eukprot:1145451-Prorocentrum_minimum.AAC.2
MGVVVVGGIVHLGYHGVDDMRGSDNLTPRGGKSASGDKSAPGRSEITNIQGTRYEVEMRIFTLLQSPSLEGGFESSWVGKNGKAPPLYTALKRILALGK